MLKLTIIIPVYNVEKYIRQCLESIFIQKINENKFEVIVINDGTPDKSMNIISEYAKIYSNITIIEQENKGLSEARNTGLRHAKGKYIWFIDSDDTITNDSIQILIDFLKRTSYDIVSINLNCIKENTGIPTKEYTSIDKTNINSILTGEQYLKERMHIGASPRFIYKRLFLIDNNLYFYPGIYHEDIEFSCRVFSYANEIYVTDWFFYNYMIKEKDSITTTYNVKRSFDYIKIALLIEEFVNKNKDTKINVAPLMPHIIYCILSSVYIARNSYKDNEAFKDFIIQNRKYFNKALKYSFTRTKAAWRKIPESILLNINPILLIRLRMFIKN